MGETDVLPSKTGQGSDPLGHPLLRTRTLELVEELLVLDREEAATPYAPGCRRRPWPWSWDRPPPTWRPRASSRDPGAPTAGSWAKRCSRRRRGSSRATRGKRQVVDPIAELGGRDGVPGPVLFEALSRGVRVGLGPSGQAMKDGWHPQKLRAAPGDAQPASPGRPDSRGRKRSITAAASKGALSTDMKMKMPPILRSQENDLARRRPKLELDRHLRALGGDALGQGRCGPSRRTPCGRARRSGCKGPRSSP